MQAHNKKLRILFLCTGNSARSQMAEGWAQHLKGDVIEPYSADVDIPNQRSKLVREFIETLPDSLNTN